MGEMRRLDIELTDDVAGEINSAIECGDYTDLQDVIGEALADWRAKREAETTRLRELIQEGLNSGEPQDITDGFWEDIKRSGRDAVRREQDHA